MLIHIISSILSFASIIVFIPKIPLIYIRKKILDVPDHRKIHTKISSRLGGIAFFPSLIIAICIIIPAFHSIATETRDINTYWLILSLGAGFLMYIVGISDNIRGISYKCESGVKNKGIQLLIRIYKIKIQHNIKQVCLLILLMEVFAYAQGQTLSFQAGNDVLMDTYKDNNRALSQIGAVVRGHMTDILNGDEYTELSSLVDVNSLPNHFMLNTAAIPASAPQSIYYTQETATTNAVNNAIARYENNSPTQSYAENSDISSAPIQSTTIAEKNQRDNTCDCEISRAGYSFSSRQRNSLWSIE